MLRPSPQPVMAGLVPAIHVLLRFVSHEDVDARVGKFTQPAQA